MRKLRGRGSAGRAMRSQRIGQGFESPRLHQNIRTPQCRCPFVLRGYRGANRRAKAFSFEARIDFQMCEGGQKCAQVRRLAPKTLSPFTDDGSVSGNKPKEEHMRRMILWRSSPRRHTFPRRLCGAEFPRRTRIIFLMSANNAPHGCGQELSSLMMFFGRFHSGRLSPRIGLGTEYLSEHYSKKACSCSHMERRERGA